MALGTATEPQIDRATVAQLVKNIATFHKLLIPLIDQQRTDGISPLAIFVTLLAAAGAEAKLMIESEGDRDKKVFLTTQLAARVLSLGDIVMSFIEEEGCKGCESSKPLNG